ncbi:hypothetical protein GUJ93_ZPchr0016g2550 [Zizania palustris]|uniref:Integrase catalytic domain-containing protein n=1 Tax=Zizania palustris TaxID=103762 RepID=A0A8J5W679_ZIZPA|nr:hypothetical protein GUJ93_ZPchr0016g2550 [Zizania palustris]
MPILCFQTDNGREFNNFAFHNFLSAHGILLRLTCPYTSQQNGRAEQILRTLNNIVRTLLIHANLPHTLWPDALATSTYLLNRRPSRSHTGASPYQLLFARSPDYSALRVFGCLCYPNTTATAPHKLSPRSLACIFLGYSTDSKECRCYDPVSARVLVSRHVQFDENIFPYRTLVSSSTPSPSNISVPIIQDPIPILIPKLPAKTATTGPIAPSPATPIAASLPLPAKLYNHL